MSAEELGPEFSSAEKESLEQVKDRVESGEIGGEEDRPSDEKDQKEVGLEEQLILNRIDAGGDQEEVLKDIAAENQSNSESKDISLEDDPKLKEIRQELTSDWESTHGSKYDERGILSAEYQDFYHGSKVKPSIEERARGVFVERYPEEAHNYQEKEQTRIYEDPANDPAIRDLEERITNLTNQAVQSEKSGMWGEAKADEANRFGNDRWESNNIAVSMREWDRFVERYPEKVEGYIGKFPEIRAALERQNEDKQVQGEEKGATAVAVTEKPPPKKEADPRSEPERTEVKGKPNQAEETLTLEPQISETDDPNPLSPGNRVERVTSRIDKEPTVYNREQELEETNDMLENPQFWKDIQSLMELFSRDEKAFQQEVANLENKDPNVLKFLLSFLATLDEHLNK
ncbi:hypothetical protein IID23_01160 [Patescibacteria group bacterium]|nr:hypothetical protein [Patescibacteria group bacterium]